MSSQVNIFISKFFHSQKYINNIKKYSTSKISILSWLFEMENEERIKTFSLVNYDICRIMIKMYDKFNDSNAIKFKINLRDKKPIINHKEFTSIYYSLSDDYKFFQKLLLDNLRFYKINKTNDAVTLSEELLMNPQLFCEVFDILSNNNFLKELCPVVLDQKKDVYTSSSPKWIEEKEYYNISQIIIGYFENILNIKYTLSKRKKNDINNAFTTFFNKKNTILDLIQKSNHIENLYDMIDLKKIISDVINDKALINDEERRMANKKYLMGIYKPFKMFEPPVEYNQNQIFYKYKELLMEKSEEMLKKLVFFPFEGENAIDRYIKERIFDALYLYAEKKRIENVLIEISEDGFLTNNKKKIKKKKKKNKKNETIKDINEDNILNNHEYKDNLNMQIDQNNRNINTQKIDEIKVKNNQNKEENNNTIISKNCNNNNNKNGNINSSENIEYKNVTINEIYQEQNNKFISNNININISPEKKSIEIINEKENMEEKENSIIDKNNFGYNETFDNSSTNNSINKINEISDEEENEEKKEDEKEIEPEKILLNIKDLTINKKKKKRKKKPKKKKI